MRTLLVIGFLCCCCISTPSAACLILPDAEQREHDRQDLRYQRQLVQDAVVASDLILIAKAVSGTPESELAVFEVTRNIKGQATSPLSLTLDQRISVGCYPSSSFFNVNIQPGQSYILYVKAGRVLRAGAKERGIGVVSFTQELRLVRQQLGSNNSFKPKPLRGSA